MQKLNKLLHKKYKQNYIIEKCSKRKLFSNLFYVLKLLIHGILNNAKINLVFAFIILIFVFKGIFYWCGYLFIPKIKCLLYKHIFACACVYLYPLFLYFSVVYVFAGPVNQYNQFILYPFLSVFSFNDRGNSIQSSGTKTYSRRSGGQTSLV